MSDRGRGRGRGGGGRGRGRGRGRGAAFVDTRGQRDEWQDSRSSDHGYANGNGEYNAHLTERFKGRPARFDENGTRDKFNSGPQHILNADVAKYVKDQDAIAEKAEEGNWLGLPEIPSESEILILENEGISLPANKIDQPWTKKERYLKTHYRLLREDTCTALREAVTKFRKDPKRLDDNDTRIYEQVRVVGLTFTYKGVASRIRFSTIRANRQISWAASKRLTSGTLVALTPAQDAFQSKCFLAIVAARPLGNLDQDAPEIDIFFADTDRQELDPQIPYTMIEATQGYFEAYRHTLRALQKQSCEEFPLSDHICRLNTDVEPPNYLKESPIIDITPAADEDTIKAFQSVDVVNEWPEPPSTALDATQWAAMKDVITKKVAIIQGPPGTGKTHVSKIAIEIMIRNRKPDDPPIIVACQTNHALDQLLDFIQVFEPNFIRLGGRSTNAHIKKRALHEVRKGQVYDDIPGSVYGKARRDIMTQTLKLKSALDPVKAMPESGPLDAKKMSDLKVISPEQLQSLEKGAEAWVVSDATSTEPLQMWLGGCVAPFVPKYSAPTYGFQQEADEDLELEQLKEYEAEFGIADEEDYEMLKGDFVAFGFGQTMPLPTLQTTEQAKRMLDTTKDLYKIPEYLKGAVYLVMQERALREVRVRYQTYIEEYMRICSQIQVGRWEKDVAYLSEAPIIGMTTTGLSKYRAMVSALKPKIILIEEAAEVLEAPVAVACVPSVQHLVLVGDHLQLQAHCSVPELAGEPYFLNISMFERLVRNKMPHKTLLRQRRMEPQFRELIQPFYPKLKDHDSIQTRPRTTWGMGKINSWFFNHEWEELQDETMSMYNQHEADLVAKFYRHLVRNGVPAAAITILTFYNGQRKKILKALKSDREIASVYNRVKTVDSYQGEENSIVILSLVRNNSSGKIGFLDINNRIVVALSRARDGFYIFGNGAFLAEQNECWSYVEDRMYRQGRSDQKLPLTCSNHGNLVWVKEPEDFDELDGGCKQLCGGRLTCGHPCPFKCHPKPHEWLSCNLVCEKPLSCGHKCQKLCCEQCDCECEGFQSQKEQTEAPRPTWQPLKDERLTESNMVQMTPMSEDPQRLSIRESQPQPRPKPQTQDVVPKPLPPKGVEGGSQRDLKNGRIRYEETWDARQAEAIPQGPKKMNTNGQAGSQQNGLRERPDYNKPSRQPQGPKATGFQGIPNQKVPPKPNTVNTLESSLVSWDSAQEAPRHDMSQWFDDEDRKQLEEQNVQRQSDDFW